MNAVSMRTSSRAEVRSGPIYFSSTLTLVLPPHDSQRQVPSPLPLTHGGLVAGELHFTQKYVRDFFIKKSWPIGITGETGRVACFLELAEEMRSPPLARRYPLAFHPSRPTYYQRVCGYRPRSSTFTTNFQILKNTSIGHVAWIQKAKLHESLSEVIAQKTMFEQPEQAHAWPARNSFVTVY